MADALQPETEAYTPLRGRALLFAMPSKAYLGTDHLLVVTQGLMFEHLERYYFADVEAISCVRTNRGRWVSAGLALAATIFLLAAFAIPTAVLPVVFGILGVLFAVFTVINMAQGPTCVTTLHTRVHSARISCFSRWRTAQPTIATLRHAVSAAQGSLPPESLAARLEAVNGPQAMPTLTVARFGTLRKIGAGALQASTSVPWTRAGFVLLLFYGVACLLNMVGHDFVGMLVAQILLAVTMAVIVVALVKQYNTDVPKPVAKLTWIAFIELVPAYGFGASMSSFRSQLNLNIQYGISPDGVYLQVLTWFHGVVGLITLVTAVVGLLTLARLRGGQTG